jgi:hypothetical protein
MGICIPATCSAQQVKQFADKMLAQLILTTSISRKWKDFKAGSRSLSVSWDFFLFPASRRFFESLPEASHKILLIFYWIEKSLNFLIFKLSLQADSRQIYPQIVSKLSDQKLHKKSFSSSETPSN